ncbi:MAG: hypothetical protein Tsb002_17530 [Wenzhouxiangellaceae bacterium]
MSYQINRLTVLLFACLTFTFGIATAQDWVAFDDVTSTQLQADASVGSADPFEKDLAAADLDRDGDIDVIVVRKSRFSTPGGQPNVLFMNENGVLVDRTAQLAPDFADPTDDRDAVIADVDGDGWLDMITATTFGETPRVYMNLGESGGQWQGLDYVPADQRIQAFPIGPKFCAVAAGDVNNDQRPDLFFVDYDNDLEDRLLINDGNGFYTDQTATRMTPAMSESVFGTGAIIVDVNGDGFNDIVKNSASGSAPPPGSTPPQVRVLYNDGSGNFTTMSVIYDEQPYMVQQTDYNRDGRVDFYVVDDAQDSMLINTGNVNGIAQFQQRQLTTAATSNFGGNITLTDLDNDTFPDALIADVDTDIPGCTRRLAALRHNGIAADPVLNDPLSGQSRTWLTNGTFDTLAQDFNNDGAIDLWLGTCDGNRLFFGQTDQLIFGDGFE